MQMGLRDKCSTSLLWVWSPHLSTGPELEGQGPEQVRGDPPLPPPAPVHISQHWAEGVSCLLTGQSLKPDLAVTPF